MPLKSWEKTDWGGGNIHPTQEKLNSVSAWHRVIFVIPIYTLVRGEGTRLGTDLHPDSS